MLPPGAVYINSLETYAIGLLWPEDYIELLYPDTGRYRGIFIFNYKYPGSARKGECICFR